MQRHSYRLYVYGKDGGLIAPAMALNVDNDEAALAEAGKRINDYDAELRDDLRLVRRWPRDRFALPPARSGERFMPSRLQSYEEHAEQMRLSVKEARKVLQQPCPDSFAGRKTHEPFPLPDDDRNYD